MKKWHIVALILALVAINGCFYFPQIRNSIQHDRQRKQAEKLIASAPEEMEAILSAHRNDFETLCGRFVQMQQDEHFPVAFHVSKSGYITPVHVQRNPTDSFQQLRQQLQKFIVNLPLPLSEAFCADGSLFYYPKGFCVFRFAIRVDNSDYAYVDLIYSEDWAEHKILDVLGDEMTTALDENWRVMVLRPR